MQNYIESTLSQKDFLSLLCCLKLWGEVHTWSEDKSVCQGTCYKRAIKTA